MEFAAVCGSVGTILLDPPSVEVIIGGLAALTDVDEFADPGATVQIDPATIDAAAATAKCILCARGLGY